MKKKPFFLAITGVQPRQRERIVEIGEGYECWDIEQFTLEEFIEVLKEKIPGVRVPVLSSLPEGKCYHMGITQQLFRECRLGLLIPESLGEDGVDFRDAQFVLDLYTPGFVYVRFHASHFGTWYVPYSESHNFHARSWSTSIFQTEAFRTFYRAIVPHARYQHVLWGFCEPTGWGPEDFRLLMAYSLYEGLKEYDGRKAVIGWEREYFEMTVLLEALFTADDCQSGPIGARLRQRVSLLLSRRNPGIEDEIRELSRQRSAFVHGGSFTRVSRDMRSGVDYRLLDILQDRVRQAFTAYLYLAQVLASRPERYRGSARVIDVLDQSDRDFELRARVIEDVDTVLSILPLLSKDGIGVNEET